MHKLREGCKFKPMKKNFNVIGIVLFLIPLLLLSCGQMSPKEKELDALHRTVMSIHDDVMPEISTIRKLHKKVKKHEKASTGDFQKMLSRLDEEDDAMMDWMHEFKKPDYKQYEVSKKYLLSEKIKIEKVREGMLNVIDEANKLLNN